MNEDGNKAGRGLMSPDIWIMLRPGAGYQRLVRQGAGSKGWAAAQRPLFIVLALGCLVSLVTAGGLSLRLFAAGAVNALFVPLLEIAVLAGLWRGRRRMPFAQTVDLFFMGHGPWVLYLLIFSAIWAFASPVHAFALTARWMWLLLGVMMFWSVGIDFCFLRYVLGESDAQAGWKLVVLRVITWSVGLEIFGGGSLWPEMLRKLGI
ncbi:MAG TPA: hypothetical protein VKR57_07290 [Terriglobales bacterium]|nr:hypothetical protein [Terriglobales bacterium]